MKPSENLMDWKKGDLAKEVARLRAILHEHSTLVGDDARQQSTSGPIIGGSPTGRGDALLDARAAVLLDAVEVALVDTKRKGEAVAMMLTMGGRINYSDERVTHAYLLNGDGAAGIVSELIQLVQRCASMGDHAEAVEFAADFKLSLEGRMR
jgi:hypothetical protein